MAYNSKYTGTEIDNAVGKTTVLSNQVSSLTTQVNQVDTNLTQLENKVIDNQQTLEQVQSTADTNAQVISNTNNSLSQLQTKVNQLDESVMTLEQTVATSNLYQYIVEISGIAGVVGNHIIFSFYSTKDRRVTPADMQNLYEIIKATYKITSTTTFTLPCNGVLVNKSDNKMYIITEILLTISTTGFDFDIEGYNFINGVADSYEFNIGSDSDYGTMEITQKEL